MLNDLRNEFQVVITEYASKGESAEELQRHIDHFESLFVPTLKARLEQLIGAPISSAEIRQALIALSPQVVPSAESFEAVREPLLASTATGRWESATTSLSQRLGEILQKYIKLLVERLEKDKNRKERKVLGLVNLRGHEIAIIDKTLQDLRTELDNTVSIVLMNSIPIVDDETTPEAVQEVLQIVEQQRNYIENSLIPDIRERTVSFMESGDSAGFELGALAVALSTAFLSRAQSYGGSLWSALNRVFARKMEREGRKIYWKRDSQAKHCDSCLEFGEREYASFQDLMNQTGGTTPASGTICGSNCRCSLLGESPDSWVRL